MRRLKTDNYEVVLNERDYHWLLRRFDLEVQPIHREGDELEIRYPCICGYYRSCSRCPLGKATGDYEYSCILILDELVGVGRYVDYYPGALAWPVEWDTKAREEISIIHDWLLSAEKIVRGKSTCPV